MIHTFSHFPVFWSRQGVLRFCAYIRKNSKYSYCILCGEVDECTLLEGLRTSAWEGRQGRKAVPMSYQKLPSSLPEGTKETEDGQEVIETRGETGVPVYVNVYDMVEQNAYLYWAGIGIYHSGVEIYGREYAYGGHEYDAPGIFATLPEHAPGNVVFRERILVGTTELSPQQVYRVVQELGREFKGNRYHLLQMNCNTFSSELCYRLTGKRAPGWINRLADLAVNLHCLLPTGWVPPLRPPMATSQENLLIGAEVPQAH